MAITQVHEEPGVELYALHEGRDRLIMIDKYESEQARSEHAKGGPRRSAIRLGGHAQQRSGRAAPPAPPGRKHA